MRDLGAFLTRVCVPLVRGGEIAIGRPIAHDDLASWNERLPYESAAQLEVDEARQRALAELIVRVPPLVLDEEELSITASVHNLLFLVHPRADTWTVSQAARKKVLATAHQMAQVSITTNRRRLLGRHALLHNLFALTRHDVKVSWWTGSRSFQGQRPPERLVAWPGLRRVRCEERVIGFDELFGASETGAVVTTLLRRSPLTQLLGMAQGGPPLHWEDALFVLRDVEMARVVAHKAVVGADARAQVAAPARLAAAFEQMLERAPAEADVRAVAAFLVYLNALFAAAESGEREPGRSALLGSVLAPERAGQRPRGLATFFALPEALAQVDARLAMPPGLSVDPMLLARWQQHRAQVAEGVGDAVVGSLVARLRRHLLSGPGMLNSAGSNG